MKLQGKKTGTVANFIGYIDDDRPTTIDTLTGYTLLTVRYKDSGINCYKDYRTIAEFNEDWEDYKPSEPLIKDEKVRKLVSDWAKMTQTTKILAVKRRSTAASRFIEFFSQDKCISISILGEFSWIEDMKEYSTEELCGEEE